MSGTPGFGRFNVVGHEHHGHEAAASNSPRGARDAELDLSSDLVTQRLIQLAGGLVKQG